MNKTRMGKRVASLLLSLVMMLSLLPTAAYAAMGDADDTQGASVSENGTRVSDDDNSGGDTDDLQVGDSEGNGDTGAQQVGDSEDGGSTGAEGGNDTTGAEGGADPTGSVNATTTYVAYIGEVGYETLDAAITAAGDGETVVVSEGEYTLNGSLTYTDKAITVKAADGAKVTFDMSKAVALHGAKITFENVTFNYTNADYTGLQHTDTVVYNNCTINGKMFLYANSETFNDCHFVQKSEDYNVWTYGAKKVAFNNCTFDCVGKAVNVYIEKGNASDDAKTVEVNGCTVNSDKAGKAFLNIKNSTQAYDVTLSGTNTVTGLAADGTTGSALYQVEATKVTETTGKTVSVKEKADDGTVKTVYEVKQPSANVAKVGSTEYATLADAIAALSGSSYTLELLDETAWNVATPVYWAAGTQSGFVATLADALTAAYKANVGAITIVCRPGADVGKLTHGHVADNITIYGNNAYISSGECELEVDTFMYSRETGKQVTTGGAYLDKDITVTAYELDNLGVSGERHTDHKVTVNLTDCDTVNGITVQRVYISGTTGVNDITLTGCDFGTKATSVYSNADGAVVIDNCSFTGAQVPVNFNHKAGGTQTVTVRNSKFTNCGDNDAWKQFAAPVRFVNSGSGTMTTSVDTCTFTGTVGGNGDILLGDGREGQKSNDVTLTVKNTAANVQAQQPGYYGDGGTKDESKLGEKTVAAGETLTTSVNELVSDVAYVAAVGEKKFESLQAAIDAAGRNATVRLLADTRENVTISTNYLTLDLNGHTLNGGTEKGKPALTVTARVTVKDSSAAKTGTIMREDTAENSGVSSHYVIDIQDGWLFFESGNVTNNSGNDSGKGASLVRVGDDSIAKYPGLTISGGTFTQDNFIVIKVDRGTFYLKEDGTLNSKNSYAVENWKFAEIKGGTVNGTVAAWTYSGGHNSDLTISGGTVNGNVASVSYDKAEGKVAKVSITGGTVTGTLGTYTYGNGLIPIEDATKATIAVTGGTFSKDPTKYVVEDSGVTKNTDGTYGVAKAYLAKVGDTSYYTMEEAFKAQTTSSEAIVLLRDYTTGSTFNSGSINRTVDLNGHTWTCTGTDANSAAFEINYSDASLTVKNGKVVSSQLVGLIPSAMGGTIKYDNSSLVFDGVEMTTTAHSGIETNGNNTNDTVTLRNSTLNVPNGFGIYFPSSGTLTIDNSKINAKTMGVQVCAGSLNISGAGTAITVSGDGIDKTINDGAIEDGAAISIVERTGYKGLDKVTVEGGTFTAKGSNAAVKAYDWDNTNKTESSFTQAAKVAVSGGTFSSAVDKSLCADGFIPTQNEDGTYGVKEGKFVAEIGSQGYESLQAAINAAEDGQTVTLLADATEDVVINKSITLDLGGKTLTNTNAGKATISVTGGTVTVKNGNVVGGTDYYNIEVTKGSGADLTLTDVTATAGNNGSSMIDNYGTLTITSGTYTGGLDTVKNESSAKLNITGGTFTLTKGTSKGFTGVVFNYGELTISGGTFIQSDKSAPYGQAQVIHTDKSGSAVPSTVITGGTFKNLCTSSTTAWTVRATNAAAGATKVSGGAFNKAVKDYYCAEGFIPTSTKDADGNYGVKVGKYVAEVGSKKYETLADAIRLATKGKTVTLLCDVEQNAQLTINKNITLDLNGKTIKNTVDIWGKDTNAILSITNGAKVTITGNGTIDAKENDCYTINVVKGDLTIENGTFYGNVSVVQVQEGTLSVKGGTFDLHQKWEGSSKYLFNCIDDAYVDGSADVAISGGTFVGFDPNVSPEQKVDGKAPSFAAPGAGITKNEDGSFTAAAGMTAQILDKDGNSVKAYRTLADAVAAAQDGQTVRLLADVTESNIKVNANITIDLNKMTVTGSFVTYGEVTIQNGTIDVPDGKTNYAYGKLTLVDVDITGKAVNSSLLSVNYNGSVTIDKDSTIVADSAKGDYPAVFIKGQDDSGKTYAPELNIYGTVQSAKTPAIQGNGTDRGVSHVNVFEGAVVKSESLAVYLPQPCEVNITGGLVEGYCGIGIKSGTLNISGGTVRGVANDNVIGDQYSQTNGISYDGSAIMIDSYIGYAGQVQINISGNAVVESKYSTAIREIGNDKSQTNLVGLDITGGTVLGAEGADAVLVRDVTAKDVNISGGEFSSVVKKEYCAPGFTPVTTANSEGRYGVEIGKFTVKVTSRTTGSDSPVANVAGGGSDITYAEGTTVTASAISGYNFVGWFVNEYTGTAYSTDLTCEVKPTDDCTMIAVYEPISGGKFWLTVTASEFTVNGGAVQDSYLYEQFAVGASVTVNFTGSENFLYWVNASNKVVSTDKSYSFIMGSETTLKAVYGKARQNQATVVFISHSDQIISSKAYTTSDTIQFPVPPIKMGCTFTGWSMTEADIRAAMANNSGIIQVRALYTEPSIACKVTVVYPEGTDNQVVNAVVGKAIDVTAKDIEGKTFSYWTDNDGNILGYTKTLKLAPSGDMTVKAVYGENAEVKPVISMTAIDASAGNGNYVISFTATRAVPEGYELVKQGVLYSANSRCAGDAGKDYLKLTTDGKVPEGVYEFIGKNTELSGVTRFNGKVLTADTTLYGRGYMILKNSAGEVMYVYADTILSGSYNSLTTNGGN